MCVHVTLDLLVESFRTGGHVLRHRQNEIASTDSRSPFYAKITQECEFLADLVRKD